MKILIAHNVYQQRAGEEAVVAAETRLLREHGHDVVCYERCNDELLGRGRVDQVQAAIETVWSLRSFRELAGLMERERPLIAHFHNTFPLISPSAYYACARAGVAVVQTLHNYRLLCPAAKMLRDGAVCEACLGRNIAWRGVAHACYRESRAATAVATAMLAIHRGMGTWHSRVDAYIALSEFARRKFIAGGFPSSRIAVKPNFVVSGPTQRMPRDYVLYVGRLSEEKGPRLLVAAWRGLQMKIPLLIAGDGPLSGELAREIKQGSFDQVELLGHRTTDEIRELMDGARFLVFPSTWYESAPMTIVEAFSRGLPVVASRLGSMAEIVEDGVTGLHFEPGATGDLADKVQWAWTHPTDMEQMAKAARATYEARYLPSKNYEMLMDIYRDALMRHSRKKVIQTGTSTQAIRVSNR